MHLLFDSGFAEIVAYLTRSAAEAHWIAAVAYGLEAAGLHLVVHFRHSYFEPPDPEALEGRPTWRLLSFIADEVPDAFIYLFRPQVG